MNIIGDVKGKTIVIYDDICDTAGSLTKAANAIKAAGAKEVYGCVTHAVLSGQAIDLIRKSAFTQLYFSDTIAISDEQVQQMGIVKVISCAELISKLISFIHNNESYGEYITQVKEQVRRKCLDAKE